MSRPPDPPDLIREAWMTRFGIFLTQPTRDFPASLCDQLSCCRSDEARRIILGRTEKYQDGEGPLLTDALIVI